MRQARECPSKVGFGLVGRRLGVRLDRGPGVSEEDCAMADGPQSKTPT